MMIFKKAAKKAAKSIAKEVGPEILSSAFKKTLKAGEKDLKDGLENFLVSTVLTDNTLNEVYSVAEDAFDGSRDAIYNSVDNLEMTANQVVDKKITNPSINFLMKRVVGIGKKVTKDVVSAVDSNKKRISEMRSLAVGYSPVIDIIEKESKNYTSFTYRTFDGAIVVKKTSSHPFFGNFGRKYFGQQSKLNVEVELSSSLKGFDFVSTIVAKKDEESNYNYRKEISKIAADIFSYSNKHFGDNIITGINDIQKVSFTSKDGKPTIFQRTITQNNGDIEFTYTGVGAGISSLTYQKNQINNNSGGNL